LYTQILSVYPSAVKIVSQVLGIIIASDENLPEVIEDILGMEEGEVNLVLRGLSFLMEDENDENGECLNKGVISLTSFSDYLFNPSPSRIARAHIDDSMSRSINRNKEYENYFTELCTHYSIASDSVSNIFIRLIIRNHDRMSSITRVLHAANCEIIYLTSSVPFSKNSDNARVLEDLK
jgi:hypothetical protein